MNSTNRIKWLLGLLLVCSIFLHVTYYENPWHPDHYTLGQYTYSLIEFGYAPWVLPPMSLFGYYPLSTPSGFEFFTATFYNLSSLDLPILFYLFSVVSAVFAVGAVYVLMREFFPFEASFLTAVIFSTMAYFVKNVSNTASSRMFNIIFYPLFILCLFKIYKGYAISKRLSINYLSLAVVLFIFLNLSHRLGQLLFIFIIAFIFALIFGNLKGLLAWIKTTKFYEIRKKYYKFS